MKVHCMTYLTRNMRQSISAYSLYGTSYISLYVSSNQTMCKKELLSMYPMKVKLTKNWVVLEEFLENVYFWETLFFRKKHCLFVKVILYLTQTIHVHNCKMHIFKNVILLENFSVTRRHYSGIHVTIFSNLNHPFQR